MKRHFVFGTMLSAVLAVGVGAQQPNQERPRSGQDPSQQATVTVTGCLQPANRGASGGSTAGDTTSKQQEQSGQRAQFVLTDASAPETGARTGTSGTGSTATGTGTGGTTTGATSGATGSSVAKSYRLTGGEDQNLQQYVNSRVEVTGTLQPASDRRGSDAAPGTGSTGGSTTGTGSTGTRPGAPTGTGAGSAGSMAGSPGSERGNMATLQVASVRQIAATCPSGDKR